MKRVFLSAAVGCALGSALLLAAQSPDDYTGSSDFTAFCVSCHGAAAKGDGVLAASLKKRPADLTQLAKNNGGVFPAERVTKTITDGHDAMPAWLDVFAKSQSSSTPAAAHARVVALVRYLETLQPKP